MKKIAYYSSLILSTIFLYGGALIVLIGTAYRMFQKTQESDIWYKKIYLAWDELCYLMSPFNIANFLAIIAIMSPGLFFYWLAERLGKPKGSTDMMSDSASIKKIMEDFFIYYSNDNRPDIIDESDIGITLDQFWHCVKVYRDYLIDSKSNKLQIFYALVAGLDSELVRAIDPVDKIKLRQYDRLSDEHAVILMKYRQIAQAENLPYIKKYGI